MNDFTKEELEHIYSAVLDSYFAIPQSLVDKIKLLIENYNENK